MYSNPDKNEYYNDDTQNVQVIIPICAYNVFIINDRPGNKAFRASGFFHFIAVKGCQED